MGGKQGSKVEGASGLVVLLADREDLHGGVITFPSGSRPREQLQMIARAIGRMEADLLSGRDPLNRWLDIGADGSIRATDLPAAI